jgi:hypothetical protein
VQFSRILLYNIASEADLQQAAQKHQEYFVSQMGTVLGTI